MISARITASFRATCSGSALPPLPPLPLRPSPAGPAFRPLRAGSASADCPPVRFAQGFFFAAPAYATARHLLRFGCRCSGRLRNCSSCSAAASAPGSGLRCVVTSSTSIRFRHIRAESSVIPLLLLVPSKHALPGALYCASLFRLRPSRFRKLHRNGLRLNCIPPTRPFFPCAPLHSTAPPCAGALQRPVPAWGAGASPFHSVPLRERTVAPYRFAQCVVAPHACSAIRF